MADINVCVLLTCYNRANTTLRALNSIDDERLRIDYLVIDDASTDGTRQTLREWNDPECDEDVPNESRSGRVSEGTLVIVKGSGSLFWAGGMRKGMEILSELDRKDGSFIRDEEQGKNLKVKAYDYLVLINDDVLFYPDVLMKMIERSREKGGMPVSGVTKSSSGGASYGGVLYDMKSAKPFQMDISEADRHPADTMNCNCFLLPWDVFRKAGIFDSHYVHSLADYDYGFKLKKMGYKVWLTDFYVGECDDNSIEGTWRDTRLGRMERLKKKESVKGLPRAQWYYYLRKNFGLRQAIWHSITPYLRILFGK